MPSPDLTLFNSLTRRLEPFRPITPEVARVYSCGPTVYSYAHLGNLRAYVFTDTLRRTLEWKGYAVDHVINITDVGHLTSDADAGEDKMEKAAQAAQRSIWDIAAHYTAAFKTDIHRLNILEPGRWSVATDHIQEMIAFAEVIEANGAAYRLAEGLYFDVSKVPDYGRLAHAGAASGEETVGRIAEVEGKRHPADFALWRRSPPGEQRQMEWDSPWGRGAPGWHLECSVMSHKYLGVQFDIHTGGIDHREIHHPNEIAQNQAHNCSAETGANIWMHNNFLVDRGAKMSKSKGGISTLQSLVDRGVHPLAYRLLCLSAHYRSELEFSPDTILAAVTRLKRLIMAVEKLGPDEGETVPLDAFDAALADDLNTPRALTLLDEVLADKRVAPAARRATALRMDEALGLDLATLTRADLRVRPADATLTEEEVEARLADRAEAKRARDFARADGIRDALKAEGVEPMDGDPLGWEWTIRLD